MLINNLDDVTEVLNLLERKIDKLERKIDKTNKEIEAVEKLFNNINDLNIIDLDIDNCVDDVIRLVNKYHFLVDDNGIGSDNKIFSDDVKNIIIKYINNKGSK